MLLRWCCNTSLLDCRLNKFHSTDLVPSSTQVSSLGLDNEQAHCTLNTEWKRLLKAEFKAEQKYIKQCAVNRDNT